MAEQAPAPAPRPPSIEQRIQAAIAPAPEPSPEQANLLPAAPVDQETPTEATEEAQEAPEAGQEASAEAEAPTDEGEAPEAAETAPDGDEEAPAEVASITDLAEHLGVDVAELYQIAIPVDIDGKRTEVSLGEWKDAYKASRQLEAERDATKAERQAMQQQREQSSERTQRALLEAAALAEKAEARLAADFDEAAMARLREEDPMEWAAKRQELFERQNAAKAARTEVEEAWQRHVETQQAAVAEATQEQVARERELLHNAIPEWRNEQVQTQEVAELRDYLVNNIGFGPGDVDRVYDHRLIVLARKARAFDNATKQVATTKKKVVHVGKRLAKPGAAASKQQAREDRSASLSQKLRKSGRVEDAAAIIAARLRK